MQIYSELCVGVLSDKTFENGKPLEKEGRKATEPP